MFQKCDEKTILQCKSVLNCKYQRVVKIEGSIVSVRLTTHILWSLINLTCTTVLTMAKEILFLQLLDLTL